MLQQPLIAARLASRLAEEDRFRGGTGQEQVFPYPGQIAAADVGMRAGQSQLGPYGPDAVQGKVKPALISRRDVEDLLRDAGRQGDVHPAGTG